ncbi:MAG: hypothetical protein JNK82_00530 [Myxococcaceae bacterium]|nr:hypothetical protein [Myxococcaceae bacterium]
MSAVTQHPTLERAMKALAVAMLLTTACARQSACESSGGRCSATSELCPLNTQFTGYDPECEPLSKCCRPLPGFDAGQAVDPGRGVDAGEPASSLQPCVNRGATAWGICRRVCLPGDHTFDGVINAGGSVDCPPLERCCP